MSDNVATDLVLSKVGKDKVNDLLGRLGLPGTAVTHNCEELLATIGEDLGSSTTTTSACSAGCPRVNSLVCAR